MADGPCSHIVKLFNEITGVAYYRWRDGTETAWQWKRVAFCPECGMQVPADESHGDE